MIIGLTGLAGSGKNTVADMLAPRERQLSFAAPMKRFVAEVFGATERQLYGPSEAREEPLPGFTRPDGTPLTTRYALQTLGTEWGRGCDPDVWVKACLRQAKEHETDLALTSTPVVITDVRFVNEAEAVRAAGGHVVRIHRDLMGRDPARTAAASHASEREIFSAAMDQFVSHEIANHWGLDELRAAVRFAVQRIKGEG